MPSPILGLHHVTATVNDAQDDLDFYAGVLGLRLVKQTVNFDNRHVFHFYYGDERGTPGTIWTTFPYKGHGVRAGSHGAGQIGVTSFSVPEGSLDFWQSRLREHGVTARIDAERFGEASIEFPDPSGLIIALVENGADAREPWIPADAGLDAESAIRGLHSVTMNVHTPAPTVGFMTSVLGWSVVHERPGVIRLAIGGYAPGRTIDLAHSPTLPVGVNGLGTVHHVAMAVETADEQLRMREELLEVGVQVTPVMDRQYFTSIYFREPGGVLFEIATRAPGFTFDETVDGLGRELKLPPWEEPNRAAIEAGLPPCRIPTPASRS
jgi:glyoxalase family protein